MTTLAFPDRSSSPLSPMRLLAAAGAIASLTLALPLRAQTFATGIAGPVVTTTVPPESRMEVVPGPGWLGLALRVDKFLGRVSILRRTSGGEHMMYAIRPAEVGVIYPDRPNYQLYITGADGDAVFLVSLHTGAIWQLTTDGPSNDLVWRQVDQSSDRARAYAR